MIPAGSFRWNSLTANVFIAIGILSLVMQAAPVFSNNPIERTSRKGPVEATVRLKPADPVIGDPVTLELRVVAEKGVELIMPEFGEVMEGFNILDFTRGEKIDDQGRTVATQRYVLQPPRSGKQNIPPIMVEFVDRRKGARPAPEGLDAYELLTDRLSFEVRSALPADAGAELNPPLGELPHLEGSRILTWPWAVALLTVIGAAVFGWRAWSASRRKALRLSAYDIAADRLMKLLKRTPKEPAQVDAFFVELSAIVRWYLENRFELRAPELTTEEFLESMSRSPDLSGEHQVMLREFLRRADLVKFANFVPSEPDTNQSVKSARRFLEETRVETAPAQQSSTTKPVGDAARA